MIGYTTIGSNDLEKAKTFFDAVLAPLGAKRSFGTERMQFYGSPGGGALAVCEPYDKQTASLVALDNPDIAAKAQALYGRTQKVMTATTCAAPAVVGAQNP